MHRSGASGGPSLPSGPSRNAQPVCSQGTDETGTDGGMKSQDEARHPLRPRDSPSQSNCFPALGTPTRPCNHIFEKFPFYLKAACAGSCCWQVRRPQDPAHVHRAGVLGPSPPPSQPALLWPGCGGTTEWIPGQAAQVPGSV